MEVFIIGWSKGSKISTQVTSLDVLSSPMCRNILLGLRKCAVVFWASEDSML